MSRLVVTRVAWIDGSWIGREVMCGQYIGVLSDVEQHPTAHRTVLYLSGQRVDVRDDATITYDTLGSAS